MGSLSLLLAYLIGGLTFLPLLIVSLLVHAYFVFPIRDDIALSESDTPSLLRDGDDIDAIKRAQKTLGEQPRSEHETDVAAGYFAVCREYVPGGVNGKPPERTTPTGFTTVSTPSPSVYQSMYRSIFDRKQSVGSLGTKYRANPPKNGGNVFYVVLRYCLTPTPRCF